MSDLTLLYYTAGRITPAFEQAVMNQQRSVTTAPRLELRQAPSVQRSIWQVYRNILMLAKVAPTPFVACVEDDSLYVPEHFLYRPPSDVFAYNRNRWVITRRMAADGKSREALFYWRERTQMAQCVCAKALLIETLEERFAKYPDPVPDDIARHQGWGEPGRYEKNLGLPRRTRIYFDTREPNVTFNHQASLRGRRQVKETDRIVYDLPPWGNATALWDRIHG